MPRHKLCVVGLGYVGLPLALAFARHFETVGFDINALRISELKEYHDSTGEVSSEELKASSLRYSNNEGVISSSTFIVVCVPTPITINNEPDFTALISASGLIGKKLQKGSIIVYESTVYPGATEEICIPELEKHSGMMSNSDFFVGYSPERINPGDKEHSVEKITKVISSDHKATLREMEAVYGTTIRAGIHKAPCIRVAEAAKVIENIQRDLNIALMNELSLIFERMGISTRDVLEAAGTKWNFCRFSPGMVGGHCIGVDPYYLTYKAQKIGYDPKLILSGRGINNYMPLHAAKRLHHELAKKSPSGRKVLFMGITFKENVPDLRNSKAKDMIEALQNMGCEVTAHDPLVSDSHISAHFGVAPSSFPPREKVDAIVIFSPHRQFSSTPLEAIKKVQTTPPILYDIKSLYSPVEANKQGFIYLSL